MVLSDEKVLEFQNLYKKNFEIEISKEEAYEKGIRLLNLISIVCKPSIKQETLLNNNINKD